MLPVRKRYEQTFSAKSQIVCSSVNYAAACQMAAAAGVTYYDSFKFVCLWQVATDKQIQILYVSVATDWSVTK